MEVKLKQDHSTAALHAIKCERVPGISRFDRKDYCLINCLNECFHG